MKPSTLTFNGQDVVLLVFNKEDYTEVKAVPVRWFTENKDRLSEGDDGMGAINVSELNEELSEEIEAFDVLETIDLYEQSL